MNTTFFSHVLDDPLYVGNGQYVTVVTSGKVNIVGEERDVNKDAAAKAGLIKVDSTTDKTEFIDLSKHSEQGDRYRGAVCVDNKVYIMRTQKKHVDSVVRIACVDLATNSVEMIEEEAVSIHGTETPKTFCGHFNFGRPIVVGDKIVYPPLNSGVAIVFDTVTRTTVAHDVPNTFSSIWSTYLAKTNEVVFFPYGNKSNQLLVLSLNDNTHRFVEAPKASTFYSAFSHNDKAIGVPYIMDNLQDIHFWVYDGDKVQAIEYKPTRGINQGFKYGSIDNDIFYTHTSGENSNELVKFDLKNNVIEVITTDMALGAKPITLDNNTYLFPSIQNTSMLDAPEGVFKVVNGQVVKAFELPTNNISYGPINDSKDETVLFVPYRFNLNSQKQLESILTLIDLKNSKAKTIQVTLDLE